MRFDIDSMCDIIDIWKRQAVELQKDPVNNNNSGGEDGKGKIRPTYDK